MIANYRNPTPVPVEPQPPQIDRSWMMPGGQTYATPYMRKQWQAQLPQGARTANVGGKYGYYRGTKFNRRFTPYRNQPLQAPLSVTNPGAYMRNKLFTETQSAVDKAKAETEGRYQEAMRNLNNVGVQEGQDIDTRFDSSRSAVNQSLVDSGLANTTVLGSMRRGVERERTGAKNRLAAMLARERNQLIASRNDVPPNLQNLQQLMYQQGAGGGRF